MIAIVMQAKSSDNNISLFNKKMKVGQIIFLWLIPKMTIMCQKNFVIYLWCEYEKV